MITANQTWLNGVVAWSMDDDGKDIEQLIDKYAWEQMFPCVRDYIEARYERVGVGPISNTYLYRRKQ